MSARRSGKRAVEPMRSVVIELPESTMLSLVAKAKSSQFSGGSDVHDLLSWLAMAFDSGRVEISADAAEPGADGSSRPTLRRVG